MLAPSKAAKRRQRGAIVRSQKSAELLAKTEGLCELQVRLASLEKLTSETLAELAPAARDRLHGQKAGPVFGVGWWVGKGGRPGRPTA